jgi:hypothetical protein
VTDKTERLGDWRLGKLQDFCLRRKHLENYNIFLNLSQVFFSNTTDASIQTALGTVFADLTGTASAVELGFWDVDAGDWLSTAYTGAKRIQVVQGMPSGFPIASPIINVADIKAIKYYAYTATQLHSIAVTPVMASNITTTSNTLTLQGSGVPTLFSDSVLSINATTGVYITASPLRLASMTTTQRNAFAAANGDLIYNITTNKFQGYENGAWVNLI